MLRFFSLVLFASCLFCVSTAEDKPFQFNEYFVGEWDVQRSSVNMAANEQVADEKLGHYKILKENNTMNLEGTYFDNDTSTGEVSNNLRVYVESVSPSAGAFKTGKIGEEELVSLFNYDFHSQFNGLYTSHGEWHGAAGGFYQFTVVGWDRFIITVTPKESKGEVIMYSGRKVPNAAQKTFFQQYGTIIMIGVFFFVQMFLQNKTRQMTANRARAPVAGVDQPVVEQSGPQIEEIQEEKEEKKKTK